MSKADQEAREDLQALIDSAEVRALPSRKITQATCAKVDYRARIASNGDAQHVAVYKNEQGSITGAKVRTPDKEFFVVGDLPPLYGMEDLGKGGKMCFIVGGEIDRLSVMQVVKIYPAFAPSKGEPNARKSVVECLEQLSRFDRVVFCMDMDDVGHKANLECAKLMPPGKAFIATLPLKDPNEMLQAGRDQELVTALFNPKPYSPDGIISAKDLRPQALAKPGWGLKTGFDFFDNLQWGWRDEEIIVHGAGIGMGKSDLMYQVAAHMSHMDNPAKVPIAVFNYEASSEETFWGIAGKNAHKRFDVPDPEDGSPNIFYSEVERAAAAEDLAENCAAVFINDDNGAVSWAAVMERIRYLAHAEGVKRAFVDPVAALVATETDKNAALEKLFAEAKALCKELKIGIWFNSHLNRSGGGDGKAAEEGGRVTVSSFRGSAAIVMWASLCVVMERDTQAEGPERFITTHRALKCRKNGKKNGATSRSTWNELTGMVEPVEDQMPTPEVTIDAPPFTGSPG